MRIIAPGFTYADLREMPDDGRRYEVVEGDLCVSPAPKTRHQRIQFQLLLFLGRAQATGFGEALAAPVDVCLDEANAVQPDVLFVAGAHREIITEDNVQGVPDLVVEILSPATRSRDLGLKLRLYARFGVGTYWVVDPAARTATVFVPGGGGTSVQEAVLGPGDTLGCPLFPGVETPVAGLFERP